MGSATKITLTSGELAAGFEPKNQISAQKTNDLFSLISQHVEGIADSAAVNWSVPALPTGDTPNFSGVGNGLFAGPVIAPGQWYSGIERETLVLLNSGGLWYSKDAKNWSGPFALGFSEAPDDMAAGHYTFGGQEWVSVVTYSEEGDGEFRATDNFGTSFYDAGFLPTAIEDAETHVMGFFEPSGRFFWCARSQLFFFDSADDLSTNAEWTRIVTGAYWTGAPPAPPTCFAASPTECAISIGGSPRVIRSSDGITFAPANTGLTSFLKHLHWSASHGLWVGLGSDDTLWTAPAGMATWTQRANPEWPFTGNTLGTLRTGSSLGRTVVLAAGGGLYASRDFTNWTHLSPHLNTAGSVDNWEFVLPFNGALWVAHRAPDSASGTTLEFTMSGVLPAALDAVGAW